MKPSHWTYAISTVCLAMSAKPANAQDAAEKMSTAAQAEPYGGDIIVTARKREETSLSVPVIISAIGQQEIARRGLSEIDTIARSIPSLVVGEGGGTIQGGNVAIRGIGGADSNPLGDQAVAFNIDGVAIARASVRRLSQMDIQQIEVLKGPQALFFGKNSPGGVVSIRSADPTREFAAQAMFGFEGESREFREEGYVSGPLSDTLGARLAVSRTDSRGYAKNLVPASSPFAPRERWSPEVHEIAARGTLKWEPTSRLAVTAKLAFSKLHGSGTYSNQEYVDCPFGAPQPLSSGMVDDCTADGRNIVGEPGDVLGAIPGFNGGKSYGKFSQVLGSLNIDYDLTDSLTLTSVTGYYRSHADSKNNFTNAYYAPTVGISYLVLNIRELSEEVRLTSDFDGMLNFTVGGYYQEMRGYFLNRSAFNVVAPTINTQAQYRQEGSAFSAFGQLRLALSPTLELAGGGRYSTERKYIPSAMIGTAGPLATTGSTTLIPRTILINGVPKNRERWNDFSPEATLTWRPTNALTIFGAYKTGFLSGGFNVGNSNSFTDIEYAPETIEGFEAGIKTRLFDGSLRLDLSAYTYKLDDLQVTVPVGPTNATELRNAAGSRIKGVEFEANYRTPLDGLSLKGAIAYTQARYTDYLSACYSAQPAPECSVRFNPATGQSSLSQDLSGTQLVRAPDWTGSAGFLYEAPIGGNLKFGLSGDMSFSSSFFTSSDNRPAGRQSAYQLYDAGFYVAADDDRWKVAFIGRNLGNSYYFTRSIGVTRTGGAAGAINPVPADVAGVVSRGRELWARFTVQF
ncbi:TonB-dependent receptor [Sphingopyxis macrogoltabida]|nr:TonB-dependent receptor [Sphingopyxis macrogoltabida]ALJ16300.1 hypothetical protein LH19_26220 [Sphingopyxis macrogoltabida]